MSNSLQNFKRWSVIPCLLCAVTLVLPSCSKSSDNNPTNQSTCALSIIDASPDAPGLDLYIGGTRLNGNAITLGSYFSYFTAYAGNQQYVFYQSGTSTVATKDTATLEANGHYTLVLANSIATPDFIVLKDSYSKPAAGTISIRLFNASTDAGAIDLVDKTTGTSLIQNEAYKSASAFTNVTVNATDTLQVVKTGTTTALANVPAGQFVNGTVYTVWLYGFAAERLTAGIMQNAYYSN